MSQIRKTFERDIPLRLLFETPTIASLAESIEIARQTGPGILQTPPILPVTRYGGTQGDPEQLLARLDQLSDEEVDALLKTMSVGEELTQ